MLSDNSDSEVRSFLRRAFPTRNPPAPVHFPSNIPPLLHLSDFSFHRRKLTSLQSSFAARPAKRQKSTTPNDGSGSSHTSRDRTRKAKPDPAPRPPHSRVGGVVDLTVESSPSLPNLAAGPLPSRQYGKIAQSGGQLVERIKTAWPANRQLSVNPPRPNTTFTRRLSPKTSTPLTKPIPELINRASAYSEGRVNLRHPDSSGHHEGSRSQKPISLPQFEVVVPRALPAARAPFVSSQDLDRAPRKPVVEIDVLQQFQGPLPKSRPERYAEKKEVWFQLQRSTRLAHEKPALFEEHFGQTGLSEAFSVRDQDELKFARKSASRKKRKINRTNITVNELTKLTRSLDLQPKFTHPSRTARKILIRRFDQQVTPPLTFTNDVNSKRIHGKFQFIDHCVIGDKVRPAPASTNKGCQCTDCSLPSCLCFTKKAEKDGESYTAQLATYTRRPDGIVVLSDSFLARELDPSTWKSEITECNEFCKCGSGCWNRVIGKGRTIPLNIFQTEKCGFGVRSSHNVVRGQFIELYLGEIITEAELGRREDAENEDDPSYIYSLDWFKKVNLNTTLHVDGKYFGSAMRFVNHSCDPNARCFPVQIHKEDRKVYHLAFFAIKDIKAGVEIRIDYQSEGVQLSSMPSPGGNGPLAEGLVRCYCGEKNCRGSLWTPGVQARRRRRLKE